MIGAQHTMERGITLAQHDWDGRLGALRVSLAAAVTPSILSSASTASSSGMSISYGFDLKTGITHVSGTEETATIRTLIMDELRERVLSFIVPNCSHFPTFHLPRPVYSDLLSLMLTSKLFFMETSRVSWRILHDIRRLLYVLVYEDEDLASGGWNFSDIQRCAFFCCVAYNQLKGSTYRYMHAKYSGSAARDQAFHHFLFYASLVQTLSVSSYSASNDFLHLVGSLIPAPNENAVLFPALLTLSWNDNYIPDSGFRDTLSFDTLCGPNTRVVEIVMHNVITSCDDWVRGALGLLSGKARLPMEDMYILCTGGAGARTPAPYISKNIQKSMVSHLRATRSGRAYEHGKQVASTYGREAHSAPHSRSSKALLRGEHQLYHWAYQHVRVLLVVIPGRYRLSLDPHNTGHHGSAMQQCPSLHRISRDSALCSATYSALRSHRSLVLRGESPWVPGWRLADGPPGRRRHDGC